MYIAEHDYETGFTLLLKAAKLAIEWIPTAYHKDLSADARKALRIRSSDILDALSGLKSILNDRYEAWRSANPDLDTPSAGSSSVISYAPEASSSRQATSYRHASRLKVFASLPYVAKESDSLYGLQTARRPPTYTSDHATTLHPQTRMDEARFAAFLLRTACACQISNIAARERQLAYWRGISRTSPSSRRGQSVPHSHFLPTFRIQFWLPASLRNLSLLRRLYVKRRPTWKTVTLCGLCTCPMA